MKYVKVGGAWKVVSEEHVKIAGVWKPATVNYPKVGGVWKPIPFEKFIFICEDFSDRLYALNDTPVEQAGWPLYGTATDPQAVACDRQATSYWACSNGVYKIVKGGSITWTHTMTPAYRVNVVAVDADFNVYAGDGAGLVQKLTAAGALDWTYNAAPNIPHCIAVDHAGGQLYTGIGTTNKRIMRTNVAAGTTSIYLTTTTYGTPTAIDVVPGTPDLIIGTDDGYLLRYNASSGYVWGDGGVLGTGAGITQVRVGHDGYVYATTTDGRVYRRAFDGASHPGALYTGTGCAQGLAVDISGYIYVSWFVLGSATTSNCVRKLTSAGAVVWTWRPYTAAQMFGVACTPGLPSGGF